MFSLIKKDDNMLKSLIVVSTIVIAANAQCVKRFEGAATKPRVECEKGGWTDWFDLDDPSDDNCDTETLIAIQLNFPGKVCRNPTAVDVALVGEPMHPYVWNILISVPIVRCCSANQIFSGLCWRCHDYKVRYCCPAVIGECKNRTIFDHAYWSPWYDVDDPWTPLPIYDDDETVNNIQTKKQFKMCKPRTAIEARLTNGLPYINGGNTFIKLNPTDGLLCKSIGQKCQDYKVRFCCKRGYPLKYVLNHRDPDQGGK